jgi:hypothetical protein
MDQSQKKTLTFINRIPRFNKSVRDLTNDVPMEREDQIYLLTCAIIFLRHYQGDKRLTSYAEFCYYIVLKYAITYRDYFPLYDFSANFGYYPITRSIIDLNLIEFSSINDCCLSIELEKYQAGNYIETIHQFTRKQSLLSDGRNELGYIAPTSFGKSSVIADFIRKNPEAQKIGIVVPTKSLLMQTYRMIRSSGLNKKIIIHDEMYQGENSFIAVFTQERSLRLLNKINISFDILFIDEAHNLLNEDSRSILLSRLIAKNRRLNPDHKIIYLSPLVEDISSLKVVSDQEINAHKIPFNIKEPEIFEYRLDGQIFKYNRFVGEHYLRGRSNSIFSYITETSLLKNFLYNYRPVNIERLAKELSGYLPIVINIPKIKELVRIVKQEVHEKFYGVDCINHGIIYIHGKLPDLIKEYLEEKFKDISELRYIIANSVILEGMNLPVDNLYIMNVRSLYGKELTNLIGRVNRLNTIFTPQVNNLSKLLPKVHFLNSEDYYRKNSNMTPKIELLRSRTFSDVIENPMLSNFDFEKLKIAKDEKDRKREKCELIQKNEHFLSTEPRDELDQMKQYLIETGISEFYSDLENISRILLDRMASTKSSQTWAELEVMEKIAALFVTGIDEISDFEFSRLDYFEARKYYKSHILVSQKRSLKENIIYMAEYFEKRVNSKNSIMYFGDSYGEIARNPHADPPEKKSYVDLSTKSEVDHINLAIVKLKMEDDFVSFKVNKILVMMYDYKMITPDEYNLYVYGTIDQHRIGLTKIGLSVSLISRLGKDNQLQYLYFDQYNNLTARKEFDSYKLAANDFYRFEIERFLN